MKPDKIHDALNLINDEWIEAVEKLRSNRKRRKIWYENMRGIFTVAACLCLMFLGIYTFDNFNLFSTGYEQAASSELEEVEDYVVSEESESEGVSAESTWDDEGAEDVSDESEDAAESAVEVEEWVRTAYVKIIEWQPDGFVGTVTDATKLDAYDIGAELFVKINENSYIEIYTDTISYFADGMPDPQEIPVGTEVYVYFDVREVYVETSESSKEVKNVVHAIALTSDYWY